MRTLIFVILALLGASSFAQATDMPPPKRVIIQCGDACRYYKHAPNTGIKPPVRQMVCFNFNQSEPTNVEFMLYSSYDPRTQKGVVIRRLKRWFGTAGNFCVGSQFVEQAVAVQICNDFPDHPGNHSIREVSYLQEGLRTGAVEMCLLGKLCSMYKG